MYYDHERHQTHCRFCQARLEADSAAEAIRLVEEHESSCSKKPKQGEKMPDIRLDDLRELKDDWDNDGALAPTEDAISLAERVLTTVREVPANVVPRTDGGLQLEWHSGGIDVEISITPEGTFELE